MVPGLNTDVAHDGVDYHIQTEDLGQKNPTIVTLVYRHGAVVLREKLAYGEILTVDPSPSLIKTLMDAQHRRITHRVAAGELTPDAPSPPEPDAASSPKTVDELIEEYLHVRRETRANSAARREA
jgi:hypothetical protein